MEIPIKSTIANNAMLMVVQKTYSIVFVFRIHRPRPFSKTASELLAYHYDRQSDALLTGATNSPNISKMVVCKGVRVGAEYRFF
ncbi:hypothetical protein D3C87_1464610 [compost metagenome]